MINYFNMGGSSYDRDVGRGSSSGSFYSGGTSSAGSKKALGRTNQDSSTSAYERTVRSEKESPIVVALDVTGSNIEFARIVYDKAPMLFGQIEQQGYLKDFDICFTGIGDAYSDRAPLQVADFNWGKALDGELKKLFLEGNGGGQRKETYELAAYFFANNCEMPNAKLPFFLFIGDEAPYPRLRRDIAQEQLGVSLGEDIDTKKVFADLYKKFNGNVFFLHNPYCGSQQSSHSSGDTSEIKQEWAEYLGRGNAEKIIPIHEEKSVVDVILGTIAMVTRTRDLGSYSTDLVARGQTDTRVANVRSSLSGLEGALVPYAGGVNLPVKKGGTARKSGGRKL